MNSKPLISNSNILSAAKVVSRLRKHSTDLSDHTDEACKLFSADSLSFSSSDERIKIDCGKKTLKPKKSKKKVDLTGKTKYSQHSKTDFCQAFLQNSVCTFEEKCSFAHGFKELRPIGSLESYKIKQCSSFSSRGNCSYGYKCQYAHEVDCPPLLTYSALLEKKVIDLDEELQKKENEQIKLLSLLKFLHSRETFKPRRLPVFCSLN